MVKTFSKIIVKALSWREIDSSHRLMILIVSLLGLFNFFFGELVPVNGGVGWDGATYANMTRNLDTIISNGQLSSYYAQRILPPAVVRSLLLLAGAPFSTINIIQGFELYNLILLVMSCWLWKRLANNLTLSLAGRWLGFSGLFLSYMASKQVFFYPVLSDVTALFVGMLLLLFYVENRPIALFFTTIAGAFAWQVVGICGAMLILFMRYELPAEVIKPVSSQVIINTGKFARNYLRGWIMLLIVSLVIFAGLAGVNGYLVDSGLVLAWKNVRMLRRLTEILVSLELFFTGLPSLSVVAVALAMLAGSGLFFRVLCTKLWKSRWPLVLLAILALLVPRFLVGMISNPAVKNISGMGTVFSLVLLPPSGKFLLPIVTLSAYWGPVVMLLVLKWKEFTVEARKLGPGYMAVVAFTLPLGLSTEPRYITCAWPFFVLGAVLAMERTTSSSTFRYVFPALTILYSQFWLPINSAPWTLDYYGGYNTLYFMHQGMFMVMEALPYILYVACFGATFLWLRNSLLTAKAADG